MILADDGKIETWVGVVGALVMFLIGGGLWKLLDLLFARRDKQRKESKEDEETALTRMDKLLNRVDTDLTESRKEVHALRNELSRVQLREARLVIHVRHLEEAMRQHNIPFTSWVDELLPIVRQEPTR